ncbi:cytochrome c maturation protein CcmE [Sphingomonas sp. KRR8]|uniref:cytochrome c maturation protein CcmE n=1 Tax=Sphingomonas sp. KRR8 TaxID=2942996 RepID=UPI0020207C6F|nr:cytochrome c maturation protein CcmE [Sphingomonas sp. KRR8]URD61337.1 cytochrome c maturation protein CcmE [Sphingomonas sp. KRR8]
MTASPKNQRLLLVAAAIVALIGATLLAMWGLSGKAAYFRTPQDIAAGRADIGQPLRLGGMVKAGSVQKQPDGVSIRFVVTDGPADVPVLFRGIVPDLFKERGGVVAEGRLQKGGVFVADNILAKHDERYMPPQMGNLQAEQKTRETVQK